MAAPVNHPAVQIYQQAHTDFSLTTASERATSIVESFNRSDISLEHAQTQSLLIMEELLTGLKETSPNLEEAREAFSRLLTLQAGNIPTVAANTLTCLLTPGTLAYDLANMQADPLLLLERTLSEAIEYYLRIENREKFLLKLLGIYEDILEHLWLLPYLSKKPEVYTSIIQQGLPPLLHRSEKMMGLLQNILYGSTRVQAKHRSIAMAYRRLADPLDSRFFEEIKKSTPKNSDPLFLGVLAQLYEDMQDYLRAVYYYKKALALAERFERKGCNLAELMGMLNGNLGNAHIRLSNYSLAIEYHEKHLTITKALGDQAGEGRAYGSLGCAHHLLGNYAKAVECQKKRLKIAEALGDQAGKGSAYCNLGNTHDSLGKTLVAIEYHEKDLAIAEASGNQAGKGRAYGHLGNAHHSLGNYAKAIECHEEHLGIAKFLRDQAGEGAAYGNLGVVHGSLGNYAKAIEYQEKRLKIAEALGDQAGKGSAYCNLGIAYDSLDKTLVAIEYHEKDLAIAEISGNQAGKGRAYGHLGNAHHSLGNYAKAIECHEEHLGIAKDLRDQAGEGAAYGNLGVVHRSLGNYAKAIEYQEERLKIAEALEDRAGESRAYNALGNANRSLGNYAKAIECHKEHLAIVLDLGESDSIGAAHNNLGVSYVKLENYDKAEEHYQEGIRTYSQIQHSLKEMYHAKITIFEEQSKAYFGLEETFLLRGRYMDALVVSDSRRSRTLIDRIQTKLKIPVGATEAPMQVEEMQALAKRLGTTFVIFRFSPHEEADRAFSVWIIHPEQEIVYRTIKAPSIFNAMRGSGVTPFQDMDTSDTRGGVGLDTLFENLPSQDLVTEVDKEQSAFLQNWYNELIAPIMDVLPPEDDARITLVPDGPLMDLPFAILMDQEGKYLFEKYTISITPSIKTLHLLKQRRVSSSEKNLIVGNPTAPEKNPLPFSTKEAQSVAELTGTLPEHTFIEGEAFKTTVLAKLEGSRFIHLACHGEVEAKGKHSIYDGAFYLTPDENDPEGILYAEEIVSCDLNAELVVLSACHSGKGRQQREGVIGPVRSFIAAGAQTVVATLWTLPDSELTIDMVSQFYQHILGTSKMAQKIGRPLDKDEALREVMRMAASGPAKNRPQEWGAFFMTGALQPRLRDGSIELNKGKGEEM